MTIIHKQTFIVDRKYALLTRIAVWFCAAFVLLSAALPFLPNAGHTSNPDATRVLSAIGVVFFSSFGWYALRIVKRLPYHGVTVDNDGLWPAHASKESGLIPWLAISGFKERLYFQRLDLLGSDGRALIELKYQLSDYENLRSLVIEKTAQPQQLPNMPAVYSKSVLYHVIEIVIPVGITWLGWYVGSTKPLLGYCVMTIVVILVVHEYLTTVYKLVVHHDLLEFQYPLWKRRFGVTEITVVKMRDVINKGYRYPHIELFVQGRKKPIKIRSLGTESTRLYQVLSQLCGQNESKL